MSNTSNTVNLIGRLSKEPELRFTPNKGTAVANITIAVDSFINGENAAQFIPCVVWGKKAESLCEHMNKGCMIGLSGEIRNKVWEKKDGTKVYTLEVNASDVKFLTFPKNKESTEDDAMPVNDSDTPF